MPLGILDLRVETRESGALESESTEGCGRQSRERSLHPLLWLHFCAGLGVNRDVAKKKVVQKSEAPDEAQGKKSRAGGRSDIGCDAENQNQNERKKRKKKRPVRCIQQHTDVEFRREFRGVCKALIKKAKAGGISETRLLLQIGKSGDAKAAKRRGVKSLSEMLLDELKRRQDEREAAAESTKAKEQANEAGSEGATSDSDAENG